MTTDSRTLPGFERPPINEVALGVQFEPLEKLQSAHAGLLWSRFRSEYPTVEEQGPIISHPQEDLSALLRPVELKVDMLNAPPAPRLLFVSDAGTDLLQVQNDRFHANWRRTREEDTYPRYPHVRDRFESGLRSFIDFLDQETLGELRVRQTEVTYVNQLPMGAGWERFGEISRVLSFWRSDLIGEGMPEPEAASATVQFVISGANADDGRGRLYVDVRPSLRLPDHVQLFVMNLTARVLTRGNDPDEILEALDLGRSWVVRAFAGLTTQEMHDIWGRRNGDS